MRTGQELVKCEDDAVFGRRVVGEIDDGVGRYFKGRYVFVRWKSMEGRIFGIDEFGQYLKLMMEGKVVGWYGGVYVAGQSQEYWVVLDFGMVVRKVVRTFYGFRCLLGRGVPRLFTEGIFWIGVSDGRMYRRSVNKWCFLVRSKCVCTFWYGLDVGLLGQAAGLIGCGGLTESIKDRRQGFRELRSKSEVGGSIKDRMNIQQMLVV